MKTGRLLILVVFVLSLFLVTSAFAETRPCTKDEVDIATEGCQTPQPGSYAINCAVDLETNYLGYRCTYGFVQPDPKLPLCYDGLPQQCEKGKDSTIRCYCPVVRNPDAPIDIIPITPVDMGPAEYVTPIPYIQARDCACGTDYTYDEIINPFAREDINGFNVWTLADKLNYDWNEGKYEDPRLAEKQVRYIVSNEPISQVCGNAEKKIFESFPAEPYNEGYILYYNNPSCYLVVGLHSGVFDESSWNEDMALWKNGIKLEDIFSCQGDPREKIQIN